MNPHPTVRQGLHGVVGEGRAEQVATDRVRWTYSRVDAATGEYRRVGTIERLSRFLDRPEGAPLRAPVTRLRSLYETKRIELRIIWTMHVWTIVRREL